MSPEHRSDLRFGDIAVAQGLISRDVLAHALKIQKTVCERARLQVPIGRVMVGMDIMTQDQVASVMAIQHQDESSPLVDENAVILEGMEGLPFQVAVAEDRMTAALVMAGSDDSDITAGDIKLHLTEAGITHGCISEEQIAEMLAGAEALEKPWVLANGTPVEPAVPDVWDIRFDTDPLRVGTMGEDGRMDWKDRGEIPHVSSGDVLAALSGGSKGQPGMDVYGQVVEPVVPKEPFMKQGKGAERSADGRQVVAKVDGMPKVLPDGRIDVLNRMVIDGDVGVETGHVNFDGVLIVNGVISSGYRVKAKELQVREIQEADVTVIEHLVASEGIYGSTVQVGGNFKASHVHDSTVSVTGDLVVMREIIDSTAVISGRCLIPGGSILSSRISAKKGIQVNDVGTPAAKPSQLTVGVDRQLTIDMNAISAELVELKKEAAEGEVAVKTIEAARDELSARLEKTANELDDRTRQLHKLNEKVAALDDTTHPKRREQLTESVEKMTDDIDHGEKAVETMLSEEEAFDARIEEARKHHATSVDLIEDAQKRSDLLKETAKLDPGQPMLKAYGTILAKTEIASPRDRIVIDADLNHVQFLEKQDQDTGAIQLKQMRLR